MLGENMKKKIMKGYKEYLLDDGIRFYAKNDEDADLYRKKVGDRIKRLKEKTNEVG
jgi:histidinol phosphatase-like PHP family hydrolase|tara:strand:- start:360 stop:527 length:168 start_codon:yes stop_codon:yes gene_type:complete